MRLPLLLAVCALLLAGLVVLVPRTRSVESVSLPAFDPSRAQPDVSDLRERAAAVDDLSWLIASHRGLAGSTPTLRADLLAEKQRLSAVGDTSGVARLNSVLAGEAFARAGRVVNHWLNRQDSRTGLFSKPLEEGGVAWVYGDVGADLFGHLAIGTRFLAPQRYPQLLTALAAERKLRPGVPDDVTVPGGQPLNLSRDERIFGVAEYAKDGLLPLVERAGPDPWLGRIVELTDAILAESAVPTARGPIPADSTEVNGDMLQVLSRVYWATGEKRYLDAADRIALAYFDVMPTTKYLPPNRWDFIENEPKDRRRFRLSDHGNEILPGLMEWHLAKTFSGAPDASEHREAIRKMLDTLLEKGRNRDGLWYRVVEIPSLEVTQGGLTDNYGYLLQAFLTAALVENRAPDGDPVRAERYRQAAHDALQALPRYRFYDWQQGEMDGYADAVESALYLIQDTGSSDAVNWVDEQVPVLYGFQGADGKVLDGYLDGNFIRTSLLYGFFLSQGLSVDSWQEGLFLGAVRDGSCLSVSFSSRTDWRGSLVFDSPRHRLHLRLPVDYPRLNEWGEWFVVEPSQRYQVMNLVDGTTTVESGETLLGGFPRDLKAGDEQKLSVCPA